MSEKSLEEDGILIGHASELINDTLVNIALFMDFKKPFTGKLKLTSYNIEGKKMDVSKVEINKKPAMKKL